MEKPHDHERVEIYKYLVDSIGDAIKRYVSDSSSKAERLTGCMRTKAAEDSKGRVSEPDRTRDVG
jgi:hypothetical protein